MLTNVTVSVPSAGAGVVVITAGVLGVEAEVDYSEDGRTILDLSGKAEKVDVITRTAWVEVLSTLESVPGERKGFGLLTDIADDSRVNYGSLMAKPK